MKNGWHPQKKAALSRQITLRLSCPTSDVIYVQQRGKTQQCNLLGSNLLGSDEKWLAPAKESCAFTADYASLIVPYKWCCLCSATEKDATMHQKSFIETLRNEISMKV
ncbi:hypothetical protein AB8E32_05790 [Marinomonas polaris]|uniref:hypothetical protein n=1 Tax=Marinomonas polaris TaxID=293552 RepID=UPI003512E36C